MKRKNPFTRRGGSPAAKRRPRPGTATLCFVLAIASAYAACVCPPSSGDDLDRRVPPATQRGHGLRG